MRKAAQALSSVLLLVGTACTSAGSTKEQAKPPAGAMTTSAADARPLAVTVAGGPDEPVKLPVTTTTTTTTTTMVVVHPPQLVPADLLFAFDSATLAAQAGPILDSVLSSAKGKVLSVRIEGHTDSDGDEAYNLDLSVRRAEAVRDWFVSRGIERASITVTPWGELKPLAPNDTAENKAKNRRVEITLRVAR